MDYRMDPVLSRICKTTTVKYCSEQLESPGQGQVEECLKSKLHEGKIDDLKCRMVSDGFWTLGPNFIELLEQKNIA